MRRAVFKLFCVVFSLSLAIAGLEWHYRTRRSQDYWTVAQLLSGSPLKRFPFTFDRELGFRPQLDGSRYTATGTQANGYSLAKRSGVERVLFIGDSATARGQIVNAIRRQYGDERFEYWNAGVDGFDTSQERALYELHNARIEPDHVVLVLHNNDFTSQPVLDEDDAGHLAFYAPGEVWRVRMPWLLRRSAFVRRKLTQVWLDRRESTGPARVERELGALAARFQSEGRRFSVVVLPILAPYERWSAPQRKNRELSLTICDKLGIRAFDILPAVEQAFEAGVDPCETPGDLWHPGDAGAAFLAAQLAADGLLGSPTARPPVELASRKPLPAHK